MKELQQVEIRSKQPPSEVLAKRLEVAVSPQQRFHHIDKNPWVLREIGVVVTVVISSIGRTAVSKAEGCRFESCMISGSQL